MFLITDGQTWNENQVIKAVKQGSSNYNMRFYSIGIGNGISRNLVKGFAEEGMGKYAIITDTNGMEE